MPISTVIGMLAALIGMTATLFAAWGYISSKHPTKREILAALVTILAIMTSLVALAVLISRFTTISVNGQQTISVPGFPPPDKPVPAPTSPLTGTPTPTPPPTLTPSPTASPASSPSPTTTPIMTPTPAPSPSAPSYHDSRGQPSVTLRSSGSR